MAAAGDTSRQFWVSCAWLHGLGFPYPLIPCSKGKTQVSSALPAHSNRISNMLGFRVTLNPSTDS